MVPLLRSVLETLSQLGGHHRRRSPFRALPLERRRPRLAAEDYAARHSIDHTLDRKAELRRLVPGDPASARRYHQLLSYELQGLREVVAALTGSPGGADLQECLDECRAEIERLEVEVLWCAGFLDPMSAGPIQ
jgi:hypothetical protein